MVNTTNKFEIEQLWRKVEGHLRSYLLRKVQEEAIVNDILQTTFLKMNDRLPQLRDISRIEGWLFQIARNTLMDYYRDGKKLIPVEQVPDSVEAENPHTNSTLNEQLASWLPSAIQLLPEKYREAIYLTEIEGLTQKELAERLGISYSGAKSRVQRGRDQLKAIILECCEVAVDRYGNVLSYHARPKNCNNC